MLFCTNCGAPTGGEDKKFCTRCGAVLADEATGRPETVPKPPPPDYEAPPGSWPPAYAQTAPAWPVASVGAPPTGAPPRPDAPPPVRLRPAPPPGDGRTMWIAMVVALVLLAGGGFAVWKFVLHHGGHHPGPVAGASNQPSQAGSATASQAAGTPTPAPPGTKPGPRGFAVAVSPAVAGQPGEPQVVAFLRRYFTAINHHNYAQYAPLVVSSGRPTPQQFQNGFGSSRDSHATLTGLSPTATGVAASVSFISHQQPSASPTGTSCTSWHITLFLESRPGGYKIGPSAPGYHARYRAC